MKYKVSWLAWILWGGICLMAVYNLVHEFSNPEPGRTILVLIGNLVLRVILPVVFASVAALIISRQPRNLIGWLLFAPAITPVLDPFQPNFDSWTSVPAQLTLGDYLALWIGDWTWILIIFPIFLLILLFPTGRPQSRRWNWVAYLALGMMMVMILLSTFQSAFPAGDSGLEIPNPIGFLPLDEGFINTIFLPIWLVGLLVVTVSSVASIIVRYRRSALLERQQIKWLLYSCAIFGAIYGLIVIAVFFLGDGLWNENLGTILMFVASMAIPITIAIAILRYRLWDIDVIIRKTLVYGLLTTALAMLYFGLVTLMQSISTSVFGLQSPVIIVLSTLVIAALFNPLRNRIQAAIDRRFYRQKYNAAKALAQFAEAARNETDIECLTTAMLDVVQETMQPEQVSLWVRSQGKTH